MEMTKIQGMKSEIHRRNSISRAESDETVADKRLLGYTWASKTLKGDQLYSTFTGNGEGRFSKANQVKKKARKEFSLEVYVRSIMKEKNYKRQKYAGLF